MIWMNLPEEYRKGKLSILPVDYEKDVTYGKGASLGPKEIIKASEHIDYYDEEFDNEPFLQGIELLEEIKAQTPEEMIELTSKAYPSNFTIGLGGDHATTLGFVKGVEKQEKGSH